MTSNCEFPMKVLRKWQKYTYKDLINHGKRK